MCIHACALLGVWDGDSGQCLQHQFAIHVGATLNDQCLCTGSWTRRMTAVPQRVNLHPIFQSLLNTVNSQPPIRQEALPGLGDQDVQALHAVVDVLEAGAINHFLIYVGGQCEALRHLVTRRGNVKRETLSESERQRQWKGQTVSKEEPHTLTRRVRQPTDRLSNTKAEQDAPNTPAA